MPRGRPKRGNNMKFKFLGTAAAEGFPAMYCGCAYCEAARKAGGRNLRTRSQAMIDEDFLIDYPSDSFVHAMQYRLRMDTVKYIFVTHSHLDHFAPEDATMRGLAFAHNIREPLVTVYGNEAVKKVYDWAHGITIGKIKDGYTFELLKAFQPVTAGDYTVIPLPARHDDNENCFIFVIRKDGKTILYGNDTGMLYEEVFDYLKKEQIYFDMVSLDCTMVENPVSDEGTHLGIDGDVRVLKRFRENGNIDDKTKLFATHFSHNGNPMQEHLESLLLPHGIMPAYDGLEVEL